MAAKLLDVHLPCWRRTSHTTVSQPHTPREKNVNIFSDLFNFQLINHHKHVRTHTQCSHVEGEKKM